MDPNLLYWKAEGQVTVHSMHSITSHSYHGIGSCFFMTTLFLFYSLSSVDSRSGLISLIQPSCSHLTWVATTAVIWYYGMSGKYLMFTLWFCSPQPEIQKAHSLLGSGEKLNEKVRLCWRIWVHSGHVHNTVNLLQVVLLLFLSFSLLGWSCTDHLTCKSCKKWP